MLKKHVLICKYKKVDESVFYPKCTLSNSMVPPANSKGFAFSSLISAFSCKHHGRQK